MGNSEMSSGRTAPEEAAGAAEKIEIMSPVLARLIEEVKTEAARPATNYDRAHNRHNR